MTTITEEVTDLLQEMIRNRCVNGGESRNVSTLQGYLGSVGFDVETYTSAPGRESLVARIEGSDPAAPTLMLMGHTDVVPVNEAGWSRDPFGGELIDGVIWGRGAIDMLNLTGSMAVALKHLAREGFRPRGTLIFFAEADEETGGKYGAQWVLQHAPDAIRADYVLTESACAGLQVAAPAGQRLWITVGEKGSDIVRLHVKGTPGHASMPFGADNALVKAARVIERLSTHRIEAEIGETWRRFVEGMGLPATLLDPLRLDDELAAMAITEPGLAKRAHACTHMTISPTIVQGGTAANVIPDAVAIDLNIRRLPGQTLEDFRSFFDGVLGDLRDDVEIEVLHEFGPTISPVDTPLWEVLSQVSKTLAPGSVCVPTITAGGTDAGFFRQLGATAYGAGLYSDAMTIDAFMSMFHGNDERVDQESLRLTTELWMQVARTLL